MLVSAGSHIALHRELQAWRVLLIEIDRHRRRSSRPWSRRHRVQRSSRNSLTPRTTPFGRSNSNPWPNTIESFSKETYSSSLPLARKASISPWVGGPPDPAAAPREDAVPAIATLTPGERNGPDRIIADYRCTCESRVGFKRSPCRSLVLRDLNKPIQLAHGGIGGTVNVAAFRQKHLVTRFSFDPRIAVKRVQRNRLGVACFHCEFL